MKLLQELDYKEYTAGSIMALLSWLQICQIEVTFFNRFLIDFFGGLVCVGYSLANVAHFVVLF